MFNLSEFHFFGSISYEIHILAALSSETVQTGPKWQTLESPFGWVPEQLSRFLTNQILAKLLEHPGPGT